MKIHAERIARMMVPINPTVFRKVGRGDRLVIKPTTDKRQYMVINMGSKPAPSYRVQFTVTEGGKKLVACTCHDFKYIRTHLRQCKHINAAFYFHVSRMKAEAAAAKVAA